MSHIQFMCNFELILYVVQDMGQSSFFHPWIFICFKQDFLNRLSFLHWIAFAPLLKISCLYTWDYF